MTHATGFPPIAAPSARVLILGSMPGAESLRRGQYYAHPQNCFWRVMGTLFGAGFDVPYEQRLRILTGMRVAVWDVLEHCDRPGSLDSSILRDSEVPNDFAGFLKKHRALRAIFLNGRKAHDAFCRHVIPAAREQLHRLDLVALPSTSPANAGVRPAAKLSAWTRIKDYL